MEAVTLLLFVGAVWVVLAVGLFSWNLLHANHEHAERLALLPLEDNWTDISARDREQDSAQEKTRGKGVSV